MNRILQSLNPPLIAAVFAAVIASLFLFSCNTPDKGEKGMRDESELPLRTSLSHPEWSKNATIYEVNIRQYTPEGTFAAFTPHILRLKEMGVDILWLMPIHPISEKLRKGSLGSYYSVQDYKAINPEFGSEEDLRVLVKTAHDLGMKVILDWVANHTGWDNPWVEAHPEWYRKDESGAIVSPFDWTDVADLNYDANPGLHEAMIDALVYWVKEFDMDGYRCDVAGMVPVEFWDKARKALDAIKPVFMLAEAEEAALLVDAFDMEYAWELHHLMNLLAKGEIDADTLQAYFDRQSERHPQGGYKMSFTSNHDENSWNGTVWERMGDASYALAALSVTVPGMPLVYTGQEAGLDKRLEFFEKDEVAWKSHPFADLYKKLFHLKHENKALWNGDFGGSFTRLASSDQGNIYAFVREKEAHKVVALFNLSDEPGAYEISGSSLPGTYKVFPTEETLNLSDREKLTLGAWEYRIYHR